MLDVRRAAILIAIAVLSAAIATDAAAAGSSTPPPRGVLTSTEYQELLATAKAEQRPGHGTPTHIARRQCRALTNVSRLTTTQHAECEASLVFYYRIVGFTAGFGRCAKDPTPLGKRRCFEAATQSLHTSTERFLEKDSASRKAAIERGLSGKCLNYLILMPSQKHAMRSLATGLHAFARALVIGNELRLVKATKNFSTDLTVVLKSLSVPGSVKVCRHE
jgi:hypothetical protein